MDFNKSEFENNAKCNREVRDVENSIVKTEPMEDSQDVDKSSHLDDSSDLEIAWSKPCKQSSKSKSRSMSKTNNILTPDKGRKRKHNTGESPGKSSKTPVKIPKVVNEMEEEIEKQLDEKAMKSNLTVINVKNILKHVLTNEQVLAMVRHTMHEGENTEDDCVDVPIPKLTRSKTKELFEKQPEIAWPMTQTKRPVMSECQVLIDQELPEDSSDEEYQPNEDDLMSTISDTELESQPNTPFSASTPRPPSNLDCSTQTSATWGDDYDTIGQRTRSKFSLSDTDLETLEKTLVPPDITTDMYELDCDDDDWKDFLKQFAEPLRPSLNDTIDDDDEADPEYNLLADEDVEDVDKEEELRMDRGVKVSKKELNILMKELMDIYEDYEPIIRPDILRKQAEEVDRLACRVTEDTQVEETETIETTENAYNSVCLSVEQQLLLSHQMRKHVQLSAQHFLQTYGHPELSQMAQECKDNLVFLKNSAGGNSQSSFLAANLEAALKLVQDWEETVNRPTGYQIKQFVSKEISIARTYKKTRRKYTCKFPREVLELVSRSLAIVYPLLLPTAPFRCDGFFNLPILSSEDQLIAIGLEKFIPIVAAKKSHFKSKYHIPDALALVAERLLPGHDLHTLMSHVQKMRKSKDNIPNPIKYYFQHNKAPGTDHFVVAFDNDALKPLSLQPPELLPDVWRRHIFPNLTLRKKSKPHSSFQPVAKSLPVVNNSNVPLVYIYIPQACLP